MLVANMLSRLKGQAVEQCWQGVHAFGLSCTCSTEMTHHNLQGFQGAMQRHWEQLLLALQPLVDHQKTVVDAVRWRNLAALDDNNKSQHA